jgi:hypothetical protein
MSAGGNNRWPESEILDVINSLPVADAYKDCGFHDGEVEAAP